MRAHHALAVVLLITGNGCFENDRPNANPCATAYDADGFIALVSGQHQLSSYSVGPRNLLEQCSGVSRVPHAPRPLAVSSTLMHVVYRAS